MIEWLPLANGGSSLLLEYDESLLYICIMCCIMSLFCAILQYFKEIFLPKSFRAIHCVFMLEQNCACETFHNNATSY